MHKSEKSQKSPNFLREFCVGKPVGYAEILTFGNIFCTFYLTVKKVLRQGYFSSGSPALTYSGLSTPNAPLVATEAVCFTYSNFSAPNSPCLPSEPTDEIL